MTKTAFHIIAAVLAVSAGAGVTVAQAERGGDRPTMDFETLDVDGNGEIDESDLATLRQQRFDEMDADGDGSISEAEFVAAAQSDAAERAARMFARMDADGDGALPRDALEQRMGRGFSERMISRADTDGSGGISAEEFEEISSRMAKRGGKKKRDGDRGSN